MTQPVPAVMQRPTVMGRPRAEGEGPFTGDSTQDLEHTRGPKRQGE